MPWIIAAILSSYLLGSIPTAYLFCKLLKGIDIRKVGSGNVGATNAMRVLGKKLGIAVLILDILKGFISVVFLAGFFFTRTKFLDEQNLSILLGLCSICGHNWTPFLQFKGGKGIATSFGVLLGLAFKIQGLNVVIGLISLVWISTFVAFRIVSLASISAAIALPLFSFFFKLPVWFSSISLLLCFFVLIRHKSNLLRLAQGKEPRLK